MDGNLANQFLTVYSKFFDEFYLPKHAVYSLFKIVAFYQQEHYMFHGLFHYDKLSLLVLSLDWVGQGKACGQVRMLRLSKAFSFLQKTYLSWVR
jgi:hypothetical protein